MNKLKRSPKYVEKIYFFCKNDKEKLPGRKQTKSGGVRSEKG